MNDHRPVNDGAEEPGSIGARLRAEPSTYAWVVLMLLTLTNVLSFMDRYLVNILAQPIKEDLGISDAQIGLLTGFAMSISYSVVGLPLARLSERHNRVAIITASVLAWSAMTALCGRATSFAQLMLFRAGVGIGEAGATPASHSLITDYFPAHRRGIAIAIFTVAIPIGALIGSMAGGWIIDNWGWRQAFVYLGLPGVIVAAIFALFVREVPRGRLDPPSLHAERPRLAAVAAGLWTDRVARHTVIAYTLTVLVTTGASTFFAPFLARKFAISYTMIGLVLSATFLGGGIVGNLVGGWLADRLGARDRRWLLWVPAFGLAASIPFYIAAYLQPTVLGTAAVLLLPSILTTFFTPPTYATLHSQTDPRARPTMVALVQLISSLLGGGLGPFFGGLTIDALSDFYFPGAFAMDCLGIPAPDTLQCADALLDGTTTMLLLSAPLLLWPAAHYWTAALSMKPKPVTK